MTGLINLAIAIGAASILGVAQLLIIYKMIDGELPVLFGLLSLFGILLLMATTISTKSGFLQALIFVVAIVGLVGFPFAVTEMDKAELRKFDTERLIKVYDGYLKSPNNIAAVFEIAKLLHAHGMKANAIGLSTAALNTLSERHDPISNRSLRDTFSREEHELRNWNREARANPSLMKPAPCPNCGHVNPIENLICDKCQRPYLIDIAHDMHMRPHTYGKLVLTFVILAAVVVGSAAAGTLLSGAMAATAIGMLVAGAGIALKMLFSVRRMA